MKVVFIQNNGIQESIGIANLSGILKANGHHADLLLPQQARTFDDMLVLGLLADDDLPNFLIA